LQLPISQMEKQQTLKSWEEFEPALRELQRSTHRPGRMLYRGHTDSSWRLDTTLERDVKTTFSISDYYRISQQVKPQVQPFTGQNWADLEFNVIDDLCRDYSKFSLELSFGRLPSYAYLAYLRHHGFPSPLLDWTASPYVAAYFAFRKPSREQYHAIYAYSEFGEGGKARGSRESAIYGFGPILSTHRRHFLQRSQYTICVQYDQSLPNQHEWRFASHEGVFNRNEQGQDFLTKFLIPSSERQKILKILDEFNLTSFSLFGSEESLMETLALQEFTLR
jgi:hypothetical protein